MSGTMSKSELIELLRKSLDFLVCASETEPGMAIYSAHIEQAKYVLFLVDSLEKQSCQAQSQK